MASIMSTNNRAILTLTCVVGASLSSKPTHDDEWLAALVRRFVFHVLLHYKLEKIFRIADRPTATLTIFIVVTAVAVVHCKATITPVKSHPSVCCILNQGYDRAPCGRRDGLQNPCYRCGFIHLYSLFFFSNRLQLNIGIRQS